MNWLVIVYETLQSKSGHYFECNPTDSKFEGWTREQILSNYRTPNAAAPEFFNNRFEKMEAQHGVVWMLGGGNGSPRPKALYDMDKWQILFKNP